jgi:3-hydroxybutyryl-CoA dehydrogenase
MTAAGEPMRRVAVCGGGAMGSGIAQLAAAHGAAVTVFDLNQSSLDSGRARVAADLDRQATRQKIDQAEASAIASRIRWIDDLEQIGAQDLVIEAIVEDIAVKRDLYRRLETLVGDEAIVVSNTSSLPIARLASGLNRPERFAGMHFFNPPVAMKLVEVIGGPDTAAAVLDAISRTAKAWGKHPVAVADVPGFIVNRVARPYYAEGFRAWQEGIDPGLVDELFRSSAGFRMGPLELSDLIGQDVNFAVARSVFDSYFGIARFVPQLKQAALVDGGRLGQKSGRGVFDYRGDAERRPVATPAAAPTGAPVLREAKLGEVLDDAAVQIRVTRGRTAREESAALGRPAAVIDWRAEGGIAIGFATADEHADAVARQLAASGVAPYRLPDRPGLGVARTLAQLANAAADAVFEQVSDEDGIDGALRFGANYPFGPFAWAARAGRLEVYETLGAIARASGNTMYCPSEYWSRR